ncbi:MAG: hypothetical protein R3189_04430 [Thiomicrorhabdus chilensis]|uniref:hypothetical protein n=1 Tax=Thiomicrorhabdus chilensis TaxID=63656 RepID=UPI001FE200BB|nr:hypothetical protein [Thiomicrorhabdus chilensis]MDX1347481.1 hypothetical protein [Thiomicrorhabdus chilensis]
MKFNWNFKSWSLMLGAMLIVLAGSGCEKVTNSAKNIQSDWIGLDRTVEVYSCMTGKLLKVYQGHVRLNPEDQYGASLLVNGKKLHTNLCYIISEKGLKEEPLPMDSLGVVKQ